MKEEGWQVIYWDRNWRLLQYCSCYWLDKKVTTKYTRTDKGILEWYKGLNRGNVNLKSTKKARQE